MGADELPNLLTIEWVAENLPPPPLLARVPPIRQQRRADADNLGAGRGRAVGVGRAQRTDQWNLLPIGLLERGLPGPRPGHGGRGEGQEGGLADGEGPRPGGLGVAELELEGGAGELVGEAGVAEDDAAAVGLGGDEARGGDGAAVVGAAVEGLEGRGGRSGGLRGNGDG